jgi:hypothetical protein
MIIVIFIILLFLINYYFNFRKNKLELFKGNYFDIFPDTAEELINDATGNDYKHIPNTNDEIDYVMKSFSDNIVSYNEFNVSSLPNYTSEYKVPSNSGSSEISPDEFMNLLTKIALSPHNNNGYTQISKDTDDKIINHIDNDKPEQIVNLFQKNIKTWVNRTNNYDPNKKLYFNTIKSDYSDVNIILDNFLNQLNNIYKNDPKSQVRIKKYGYEPFFIYKYKISKLERNTYDKLKFHLIIVVFKNTSLFANVIYIHAQNNTNVIYYNVKNIGQYTTDTLLLPNGNIISNNILPYNYNIDKQEIYSNDQIKTILHKKLNTFEINLEDQYVCFNITRDPNKLLLNFPDKKSCENKYSLYGNNKDYGVWDKPCKDNSECTLFKANKNYNNEYGKCNSMGYCELPLNMKPLGYHHYSVDKLDKPLCYNCHSKKWLPVTDLDTCCTEQQDRTKYPHLKGPDYAFKGDQQNRLNIMI